MVALDRTATAVADPPSSSYACVTWAATSGGTAAETIRERIPAATRPIAGISPGSSDATEPTSDPDGSTAASICLNAGAVTT